MTLNTKRILKISSIVFVSLFILLITCSYIYYLDLKRTLVAKISARSTAFIGQKVEIGDMSFSPSAGMNLYHIAIKNPDGFTQGGLLKIEKIFLKMNYSELFRGRFHFKDITVYSPELTIVKDENGRLNLSEKLMQFFKRKSTIKYRIDNFTVSDGVIDFNRDKRFRNDHVSLSVKNLSYEQGMKILIKGTTNYSGESRIGIYGWAYLKDDPQRLNISVSSPDFVLSSLKENLERYGIDTKKTKVGFSLNADGDTEKGFRLKSEIKIRNAGFSFFRNDIKEILLNTNAFLNIRDNSLSIENLSLQAGGVTAATVKGEMRKIQKDFFYNAVLKISRLDLSVFNFMKDMKVGGIITSDNLRVQGNLSKSIPDISGIVHLRDAVFRSSNTDIGGINAQVEFLSGRGMNIKAEATAKVSKAYGYVLDRPADVDIALNAKGYPENMALISSVNFSTIGMHIKGGKRVHVNSGALIVDSTIRGKTFAGKSRIEMKGVKVDDFKIPWVHSSSTITFSGNSITATSSAIEGEGFKVSAGRATIRLPGKKAGDKMTVEMEEINASYPEKDAGIRKAAFSFRAAKERKLFSGDFGFSIGEAMFSGLTTGGIKGSGRFDNKEFSIDIPDAQIPRGSVKLSARGRVSEGPFPIKITSTAENIEIGNLSEAASRISGIPYVASGNMKIASFEGTMDSAKSVHGNAGIRAEKLSFRKVDSKRNILKDVSLHAGIDFRGEDLDFRADADAGKVSTNVSGRIRNYLRGDRSADIIVKLPRVNVADIRDALWDMFPDSLLYAGMDGSLSSSVSLDYSERDLIRVNGSLTFQDLALRGENGEYSVGPINGVLPIAYSKAGGKAEIVDMPSFDRSGFSSLSRYYSQEKVRDGYSRIAIGSLQYGFKFLENVDLLVQQKGSILNIGHFSGTIFGGRLNGTATFDLSKGLNYRAGMILEGLSMTKLCEEIEPIKGYISGKVNGTAVLKSSGTGLPQVIGKADFWTYSTNDEKTKISKEFLHKMGGPSLKAYLGDRRFDKGEMSLYLQDGFVIFKDLEISHKNIVGMTDLSIKVAPFNNRIAIDHLMWSIIEAAQRAKAK